MNKTHKLAAALTAGVLLSESGSASAQSASFGDMSSNIVTSAAHFPDLISTVAYIGGIGLGVAGVFKLKAHVDQPAQHPMKDGLIRLGAGGALLSLPYLTAAMMGTMGTNGSAPSATKFTMGLT
ncbi:MAG: hypothetical protein HY052_03015 [Proteobacteria bacterium]|nr:hypothetical protein [Pseudomonadota bacterium]